MVLVIPCAHARHRVGGAEMRHFGLGRASHYAPRWNEMSAEDHERLREQQRLNKSTHAKEAKRKEFWAGFKKRHPGEAGIHEDSGGVE